MGFDSQGGDRITSICYFLVILLGGLIAPPPIRDYIQPSSTLNLLERRFTSLVYGVGGGTIPNSLLCTRYASGTFVLSLHDMI